MAANSEISWTDHTFNPVWGCIKVSPGCENCYAMTWANRYGFDVWGPAKTTGRRTFGEKHWAEPLKWNRDAEKAGKRARVFCSSMADVFEDHPVYETERPKLWALIEQTPWLDWLLLTKRPENMTRMAPAHWAGGWPQNVIAMTSVENQEYADRRIPELLKVPAARRGLSCEPLLGPVDLFPWLVCSTCKGEGTVFHTVKTGKRSFLGGDIPCPACKGAIWRRDLSWVVVGGESGHGARPMHPSWARRLREDCQNAGIAFHFKQWGEYGPWPEGLPFNERTAVSQWPTTFYNDDDQHFDQRYEPHYRLGKKVAGRLLDGRTWDEFPDAGAVGD